MLRQLGRLGLQLRDPPLQLSLGGGVHGSQVDELVLLALELLAEVSADILELGIRLLLLVADLLSVTALQLRGI